jgi:two-component system chemotaxis response regulator CheY
LELTNSEAKIAAAELQPKQKNNQIFIPILPLFDKERKNAELPRNQKGGMEMATVLIVDDAAFMRNMLKDILVKEGHQVVAEATNGEEAVLKYKQYHPDLVLMDIVMPGMDGIETVKALMSEDPAAKIIMCSALGQQQMVIEALQAGAKDFIVKPFQPVMIAETVKKVLVS